MPIDYFSETPAQTTARWYGGRTGTAASAAPSTVTTGGVASGGALPVSAIPTPKTVGELGTLADQINRINRTAQTKANQARIPGAAGLEAQSSDLIHQELGGQVPQDVLNFLHQQGAEGAPGSGINPQAAFLRAALRTSLDQQQLGQQNLTAAYARNPAAPIFDTAGQLLTPGQAGQLTLSQGDLDLRRQQEIDRVNLENQRLQLEAAGLNSRGGGGGGGYSGGGGVGGGSTRPPFSEPYGGPAYNMNGPIGPGNWGEPSGPITGLYGNGVPTSQDWSNPANYGISPDQELQNYLQGESGLDSSGGNVEGGG